MDDLFYLAIIWASVFIASYVANKTKLTAVLYYLAFGFILVNLGLIPQKASPFIQVFSELGIIIIMFALGFEENTNNFIKSIKRSWGIAFFGALSPFLAAFLCAFWYWSDLKIALLVGLAMTATAVSLTMVSLKSEGLHRSPAATAIMASAILDAFSSLLLLTILIPILIGTAPQSLSGIGFILLKATAFFGVVTIFGLWIFPTEVKSPWLKPFSAFKKYGLQNLLALKEGEDATLIVLFIAVATSILAHYFGFHPAIGAYIAGLILKEEYFYGSHNNNYYHQTKRIVDDAAFSWFGPVFFVVLGSHLIFNAPLFLAITPLVLTLTCAIIIAQVGSATLAARYTAHYEWKDSIMIGCGMLGRAELAFVVMNIGYVQYQIIPEDAFYTLMGTAFLLNVSVPFSIRLWRNYYGSEPA